MARSIGLTGRMDISQFNANVQSFMKSINDMNKQVARVAKESQAGARSAGEAAGVLGVNWQRVKDIITGVFVIDVFRQISRGLKSLAAEALDAASQFQILDVRLQSILARDFAKEFGGTVGDALAKVKGEAQELLMWIRKVAVTTPFSVETLANAIAYGQAFGFNAEQAKRLAIASGEFTAGMGLTNEHLTRIIYNFGQMLASGRVLGRELRDLANNFVPIRDITQKLADEAGIPFDEMKKAMSEGRVSAEQFIGAFVQIAETDFAGAMERMSRTIQGVRQNISDFIRTLLGIELLGPVLGEIAESAASALDRAFEPDVLRAFFTIGQTLLISFKQIRAALSGLGLSIAAFLESLGFAAPTAFDFARAILFISTAVSKVISALGRGIGAFTGFVNRISEQFGTSFTQLIQQAASWGFNIIQSLAAGMAKALIYVVQVLTAIARLFTKWLKGSSPPKLLPDLTKWGTQAINSWLEGWTSGDFGIFNDIAGTVASFLRSLEGKIPKVQIIPRIIGSRKAIQGAIDDINKFGSVTESSLHKIFKALKISSEPLKNFIKESLEFAVIEEIIEQAKKVLDFDIDLKVPKEIFGVMVDSLEDLIAVAGKFKGALGDALRGYVQALGDVEKANKRVAAAQERLNELTEMYDDRLRALRAQQTAIDKEKDDTGRIAEIEEAIATGLLTTEEKKRLELEKAQIILNQKIAALEDERDIALDTAEDRLEAERKIAEEAENRLRIQKALAQELADTQLAAAKEQLAVAQAQVEMIIEQNNLLKEQAALLAQMAKEAAAKAGEGEPFDIPGVDFEGFVDEFEQTLEDSKQDILDALQDLQDEIVARITEFKDKILAPFRGIPEAISNLFAQINTAFEAAGQNPAIQAFLDSLQRFGESVGVALNNLRVFWDENGEEIISIIGGFFDRLLTLITPEFAGLLVAAGGGFETFGKFLENMTAVLIEKGPQIQDSLQSWVDWVFEEGIPKLQEFWKFVTDEVIPAIVNIAGILKDNAPTILKILATVVGGFLLFLGVLKTIVALPQIAGFIAILQGIGEAIGGLITFLSGGGLGGAFATIGSAILPVIAILAAIGGVVLVVIEHFQEFKDFFLDVFGAVGDAIKPAIEPLKDAFADLQKAMAPLTKGTSPLKIFIGILKGIGMLVLAVIVPIFVLLVGVIAGLIRGIAEGLTTFFRVYASFVEGIQRIGEGIKTFVQGIKDIIKGIGEGDWSLVLEGLTKLGDGISKILHGLIQSIVTFFASMFGFILGLVWGFIQGFFGFFVNLYHRLIGGSLIPDMIRDILAAFAQFFVDAILGFTTWLSDTISKILEFFPQFVQSGVDLVTNLITGMEDMVFGSNGLIAKTGEWIQSTIDKILEFLEKFVQAGKDLIAKFLEGIEYGFKWAQGVYAKIVIFLKETAAKILDIKDDFVQAGKDIIAGIIEGITSKASELYDLIRSIIRRALGTAKEESETDSPSKKMHDLGIDWMMGFQQGLVSQASSLEHTVSNVFSDLAGIPGGMNFAMAESSVQGVVDKLKSLSDSGSLGTLGAKIDVNHLIPATAGGVNTLLSQPSPSYTNIRTINVEINPTYAQVQSEAGIYYDVRAAIAHMSR